jgi:uracil-DNA glycosylase family 4
VSPQRSDPAVEQIRAAAAGGADLDALRVMLASCRACPQLAESRLSTVPGDFPRGARVLVVGEAPGAQEDQAGRPFVGKGGQLLDQLLRDAGLARAEVAVANVLKCRPPNNRAPTRAEANRCRGWLDRQVALADPELVVTLGGTALAWALGHGLRLADARGRVHRWQGRLLVATYHPSAALRFGPGGAPMSALRADLALAAEVLRGAARG